MTSAECYFLELFYFAFDVFGILVIPGIVVKFFVVDLVCYIVLQ